MHADVHVVFIGAGLSGGYKAGFDAIAKANYFEKHVHYLGTRGDVDSILKELDVFIFPSLHEGFGLGLAEAMATEVPATATDLEALHEFVGDNG